MRKYILACLLVFAVTFSIFLSVAPRDTSTPLSVQTLDNYASSGYGGVVAFDAQNNPHIVYTTYDITNKSKYEAFYEIKYARWNGSEWNTTTAIQHAINLDFVMDSNDKPHIIFKESGGPQEKSLMYATWTEESGWVSTHIDDGSRGGSLALDSTDKVHVVYFSGEQLKYASWTGTNWDVQTVQTPESLANLLSPHTFLEFDSNDTAHIMYSFNDFNIHYIVGDGVNWNASVIFDNCELSDMILDYQGFAHIVYFENVDHDETPLYAQWTGKNWDSQDFHVPSLEDLWNYKKARLTTDSYGLPHVICCIETGNPFVGNLIYATLTENNWYLQTIALDTASWVGDVAVDSNEVPHVIYYGYQEQTPPDPYGPRLYYATVELAEVSSTVSDSVLPPVSEAVAVGVAVVAAAYLWKKKN